MNPQDHVEALLELAAKSPCSRDKRGAIVVRDGEVIGRGYNAPVGGACSDDVCRKVEVRTIPSTFSGYGASRSETIESVRSCGGHVEHAEAMAMRDALGVLTMKMSTYASMHSDCTDHRDMFANLCAGVPLNGCELIHLNTEAFLSDVMDGRTPRRLAKPSRRRGCPSCAVLASGFGVDAIWLLHEDGWQRWPMLEYAKLARVV